MQNIILLHGALGSQADLKILAHNLEELKIKTHCVEFPGHGETIPGRKFDIPEFTSVLENVITSHDLNPATIFGYSMGGYVALNLASEKPELIHKIITLGTKFKWTTEIAEKETALLDPAAIMKKVPKYAAALEQKHKHDWKLLLSNTADLMRDISVNNYLNDTSVSSIQNQVLIGLADKDKMVTYEETAHVFKTLPNAGMYMLPGTQHSIETVNTRLLATIISEFINAG